MVSKRVGFITEVGFWFQPVTLFHENQKFKRLTGRHVIGYYVKFKQLNLSVSLLTPSTSCKNVVCSSHSFSRLRRQLQCLRLRPRRLSRRVSRLFLRRLGAICARPTIRWPPPSSSIRATSYIPVAVPTRGVSAEPAPLLPFLRSFKSR